MAWENVSGLLGMALAVRRARGKEILLHGPPSVVSFFFDISLIIHVISLYVLTLKELELWFQSKNYEFIFEAISYLISYLVDQTFYNKDFIRF